MQRDDNDKEVGTVNSLKFNPLHNVAHKMLSLPSKGVVEKYVSKCNSSYTWPSVHSKLRYTSAYRFSSEQIKKIWSLIQG